SFSKTEISLERESFNYIKKELGFLICKFEAHGNYIRRFYLRSSVKSVAEEQFGLNYSILAYLLFFIDFG
ncbi:MAG: hypothetical protein ACE5GL_09775, partial [Calditrichia bacterium]